MTMPRIISAPQEGYWLIRLVKGGAEVPAAIIRHHTRYEPGNVLNAMERSSFLAAYIGGEEVPLDNVWLRRGRVIGRAEYEFRIAEGAWVKEHAPQEPAATPATPIDLLSVKPPF